MINRIAFVALFLFWSSIAIGADFDYEGLKLGCSINSIPKNKYKCAPSPYLEVVPIDWTVLGLI